MKKMLLAIIAISLIVGVSIGSSVNVSGQVQSTIPSWIKNTAKFWANGEINDTEFIKAMQWLIDQKILKVPQPTSTQTKPVPQSTSTQTKSSSQSNTNLYVNNEYNFSALKPDGWVTKENTAISYFLKQDYIVLFMLPAQEKIGYVTNININIKKFDILDTSFNQLKQGFKDGLKSTFASNDNFNNIGEGLLKVDGKNSFYFQYVVKINGTLVTGKEIVVPSEDKFFIITYTSPQDTYDKYVTQVGKTISSFKILS